MALPTCENVSACKVHLQTHKRWVSLLRQSWGVPGAEETGDVFIEKLHTGIYLLWSPLFHFPRDLM